MSVTVYTKPGCMQCHITRKYLTKHGIEHTTIDIEEHPDAKAYIEALGYSALPVVTADTDDGLTHWVGFHEGNLKALAYVMKGIVA